MKITIKHVEEIIQNFHELSEDEIMEKSDLKSHMIGVLWTVQTSQPDNREVIEWIKEYIDRLPFKG